MIDEARLRLLAERRDAYHANMQEAVRLGLLPSHPSRLPIGETRYSWANKLVDKMAEEQRAIAALREEGDEVALGTETTSEAWGRLSTESLDVLRDILKWQVPLDQDHIKVWRLKLDAAMKVTSVNAKIQIERFKSQNLGAIARLYERMEAKRAVTLEDECDESYLR